MTMGRPPKGGRAVQVRLPEETIADIDARVEELRAQSPMMAGITRSDVIRDAVISAMAQWRATKKPKGSKR